MERNVKWPLCKWILINIYSNFRFQFWRIESSVNIQSQSYTKYKIGRHIIFLNFCSDFDGDRYIGIADLEQAARLLTRNELSAEEISQIAEKVIEEADVDGDGKLSYMEFEHVILRAPDFLTTFHIRI